MDSNTDLDKAMVEILEGVKKVVDNEEMYVSAIGVQTFMRFVCRPAFVGDGICGGYSLPFEFIINNTVIDCINNAVEGIKHALLNGDPPRWGTKKIQNEQRRHHEILGGQWEGHVKKVEKRNKEISTCKRKSTVMTRSYDNEDWLWNRADFYQNMETFEYDANPLFHMD